MSLRIDIIPNQYGTKAVLPRRTSCEGRRVIHETVANLTHIDPAIVDGFRAVLKGGIVIDSPEQAFTIRRAYPHGHAAAVIGTMEQLGFPRLPGRRKDRNRGPAMAAAAARIIGPASEPAAARALSPEAAASSLGTMLGTGPVEGNGILAVPDWLPARQPHIERSLARRRLNGGTLVLHDASSSCLEGRCCPLGALGHSRGGRRGKLRIVHGPLCAADGCPVAVEVLPGNTADPATVAARVRKIRSRSGIGRVALVGDRGMLATARIRGDAEPAGFDWIPALGTDGIRRPLRKGPDGEPSPPVPDAVAEAAGPDFPGERLMTCMDPRLRDGRRRRREALLKATEQELERIRASVRAGRLKARKLIDRRVGRDIDSRRAGGHFEVGTGKGSIPWRRREGRTAGEAQPDGVHAIRTSLDRASMGAVGAYRSPAGVGRAFRNGRGDLRIRPVHVHSADHVRAHVFLCMLALYVEWHMRRRLAPILSGDDGREGARARRGPPVEPAKVPASAEAKADTKRLPDGLPAHSFATLLAGPATLALNRASFPGRPDGRFPIAAEPTAVQKKAFRLLGLDAGKETCISGAG